MVPDSAFRGIISTRQAAVCGTPAASLPVVICMHLRQLDVYLLVSRSAWRMHTLRGANPGWTVPSHSLKIVDTIVRSMVDVGLHAPRTSSFSATRWWVVPQRRTSHIPCAHRESRTTFNVMGTMVAPQDSFSKLQPFRIHLCTEQSFVTSAATRSRCPPRTAPTRSSKGVDWNRYRSVGAPKPMDVLWAGHWISLHFRQGCYFPTHGRQIRLEWPPTSRRLAAVCLDKNTPTLSETTKSLTDVGGIEIGALSLDDPCLNGSRVTVFLQQNYQDCIVVLCWIRPMCIGGICGAESLTLVRCESSNSQILGSRQRIHRTKPPRIVRYSLAVLRVLVFLWMVRSVLCLILLTDQAWHRPGPLPLHLTLLHLLFAGVSTSTCLRSACRWLWAPQW